MMASRHKLRLKRNRRRERARARARAAQQSIAAQPAVARLNGADVLKALERRFDELLSPRTPSV